MILVVSECVHDDCDREFDSQQGMRIHHYRVHGERVIDTETCNYCGEEFEPTAGGEGKFCSMDCFHANRDGGVTLTCEQCGDEFIVSPSDDDRKYCSMDCYSETLDTRETRYCTCGCPFITQEASEQSLCSRACRDEKRTDKPRPEDLEMHLWLLYEYEGNTLDETWRRVNYRRDDADRLTKDDVRDELIEMGLLRNAHTILSKIQEQEENPGLPEGDDTWKRYQNLSEEGGRA